MEVRFADALKEKDLLFRELQHRIKNSFMMVHGLFVMEMEKHTGTPTYDALEAMRLRVSAIAFLYTMLQTGDQANRIFANSYLSKLLESLLEGTTFDQRRLRIELRLESVEVHSRMVVPIGLIVNEAVTNCLKYAFPDDRAGTITIRLMKPDPDHVTLSVSDDGIGLPAGFSPETSTGLGTQLIHMLSDQLGATLNWMGGKGTSLNVTIPLQ
jgi:two-component sensor histidine kinase